LKDFIAKVRRTFGARVVSLRLFGSKAAGRDDPHSDIDVCVVLDGASVKDENGVLDLAFEVNLDHEVYISPRVLDRAMVEDPVWKITSFAQAVEKEGLPL